MRFRDSNDKIAMTDPSLGQSCGVGFLGEANKAGIEAALLDLVGLLSRGLVKQVYGHFRELDPKLLDGLGDQRMEQAPNVADVQRSGAWLACGLRRTNRLLAPLQHRAGFGEKRRPRVRQPRAAPVSFQQGDAKFLLQLAYLPAQGRLSNAKFSRRAREVQLVRYAGKVSQMAEFHAAKDTGQASLCEPRSIGESVFSSDRLSSPAGFSFAADWEVLTPGHDLFMNWQQRFASRTLRMRRSAIRELLKLSCQPDMISFAGGLPAPELFPLDEVRAATSVVLERDGPRALQYGETEGVADLRDWLARKFSSASQPLSRVNVMITSGAQQALDLIGRVLLDPADRVLVENPTYLALLSAWLPQGVDFIPVEGDADGIRAEALERALSRKPKLLYTVPNFQNPQGTTLSRERRSRAVEMLRNAGVAIVEDDPYGELRYSGEALPKLFELDAARNEPLLSASNVIYIGSFSKVLAPGFRLGWVIAPEPVVDQLVRAKQAADLHTSTFNQLVAFETIQQGVLDRQIPRLRHAYRERRDAMLQALSEHFPSGIDWTKPDGGMFLMVELPPSVDASAVLGRAIQQRVAFVPGEDFYLDGMGKNTFRLNFTHAAPSQILEGIRRLGGVLKEFVATPG